MQTDKKENSGNEPQPNYSNRLTITTLAKLEEQDREFTRNMTHDERMQYLNKLISITHSEEDLRELEKKFYSGKITIKNIE